MLFKLSFRNLRKNVKDYFIYFFTLVFGIAIFYLFDSIKEQSAFLILGELNSNMITTLISIINGIGTFVSIILGFLIIYSNNFIMKRRSKEFGIYLLLGMSKIKVSIILLIENFLIALISMIIGIVFGVIISQFISIIILNTFSINLDNFKFIFSFYALKRCLFYFSIFYMIAVLFNIFNINKLKLIDLFYLNKKIKEFKNKNKILCITVFLISSSILFYLYYLVTAGFNKFIKMNLINNDFILYVIFAGMLMTLLIVWSLSGIITSVFQNFKSIYYKNLNNFIFKQFYSKLNSMIFSMTIICLMIFIAITVFSTSYSLKKSLDKNFSSMIADFEIMYYEENINNILKNEDVFKNIDYIEFKEYKLDKNITLKFKDTIGELANKEIDFPDKNTIEKIISLSDYNKIAKFFGYKQYNLKDNEYIILANDKRVLDIRNTALKNNTIIKINQKEYFPKFKECKDVSIRINNMKDNIGIIIFNDSEMEILNEKNINYNLILGKSNIKDKFEKEKNLLEINKIFEKNIKNFRFINKYQLIKETNMVGILFMFIGFYIGISFLISSSVILSLKMMSDISDNKDRYIILYKLGIDEKMLDKTLLKEQGIFFGFPFMFAIIHSIFGIQFSNKLLKGFVHDNELFILFITSLFIIFIFGSYFIITYFVSKNIIKENMKL